MGDPLSTSYSLNPPGRGYASPEFRSVGEKKSPDCISNGIFSPSIEEASFSSRILRCKHTNNRHVSSEEPFFRLNYSFFSMLDALSRTRTSRVLLRRDCVVLNAGSKKESTSTDNESNFLNLIKIHNIQRIAFFYLQAVAYSSSPPVDKVCRGKPLQLISEGRGSGQKGFQEAHSAVVPSTKESEEDLESKVIGLGSDLETLLSSTILMPPFINQGVDGLADKMKGFVCDLLKEVSNHKKTVVEATLELLKELLKKTVDKTREDKKLWGNRDYQDYTPFSEILGKSVEEVASFAFEYLLDDFLILIKNKKKADLNLLPFEEVKNAFKAMYPEYSCIPEKFIEKCGLVDARLMEKKELFEALYVQKQQLEALKEDLEKEQMRDLIRDLSEEIFSDSLGVVVKEGAEKKVLRAVMEKLLTDLGGGGDSLALRWITPLLLQLDGFTYLLNDLSFSNGYISKTFLECLKSPGEIWECSTCVTEKLDNLLYENGLYKASLFTEIKARMNDFKEIMEKSTLTKEEQVGAIQDCVFLGKDSLLGLMQLFCENIGVTLGSKKPRAGTPLDVLQRSFPALKEMQEDLWGASLSQGYDLSGSYRKRYEEIKEGLRGAILLAESKAGTADLVALSRMIEDLTVRIDASGGKEKRVIKGERSTVKGVQGAILGYQRSLEVFEGNGENGYYLDKMHALFNRLQNDSLINQGLQFLDFETERKLKEMINKFNALMAVSQKSSVSSATKVDPRNAISDRMESLITSLSSDTTHSHMENLTSASLKSSAEFDRGAAQTSAKSSGAGCLATRQFSDATHGSSEYLQFFSSQASSDRSGQKKNNT
jgi:hypothetical protein